jgi:hypothetical protein
MKACKNVMPRFFKEHSKILLDWNLGHTLQFGGMFPRIIYKKASKPTREQSSY